MANKKDYLDSLKGAIRIMHGRNSKLAESVHAPEAFTNQAIWQGHMELFSLNGQPKDQRVYASAPVKDTQTAVQLSIMLDAKGIRP